MTFSILMCSRNSEKTIERAIKSVRAQSCASWELLILDNGSDDRTWELIACAMQEDKRIKGIRSERNVGWAKGAGLCLEQAKGKYMTFLAADDFLLSDGSLYTVEKYAEKEKPDIVWVGHVSCNMEERFYNILSGRIGRYAVYGKENRLNAIVNLMLSIYYNSFFHYVSIDFLRRNHIDFYEPYFADYEGMTEAMCRADKMVLLDQPIYALVSNTSQTIGAVVWKDYTAQWRSIRSAIVNSGEYDKENLRIIAQLIARNNISILCSLCKGVEVRDKEMNAIEKSSLERLIFVEQALQKEEFTEMFYYAGRETFLDQMFEGIKELYGRCIKDGYLPEEINEKVLWLTHLVQACCDWNGETFIDREYFDVNSFSEMYLAICNEKNNGVWGFELVKRMQAFLKDEVVEFQNRIIEKHIAYYLQRIYELLKSANEIKQRGRLKEVIKIVRECTEILQSKKDYISDAMVQQIVRDIKEVAGQG